MSSTWTQQSRTPLTNHILTSETQYATASCPASSITQAHHLEPALLLSQMQGTPIQECMTACKPWLKAGAQHKGA